jgi:hypothetical protein
MRIAFIWMVVLTLLVCSVVLPGVLYRWRLISPFATVDVLVAVISVATVSMFTFAIVATETATKINAIAAVVLLIVLNAAMLYLRNELEAHV